MEAEAKTLWQKRTDVTRALAAAAAEGDRSENAEYIYRKKQLREIDGRLRYLQKRMPKLTIVREVGDKNRIFFGALINLEDETGKEFVYRIVGPDEINPETGYISVDSIMAKALLGKTLDDEIAVNIAGKNKNYVIASIHYDMSN